LVLAAIAIVFARRLSGYRWCYVAVSGLAFVLSLGPEPSAWGTRILPFSPYVALTQVVPGFDGLRVPARFSVVVLLGLSVLAAIGAASILDLVRSRSPLAARVAALLLGSALVLEGWAAPVPLVAFDAGNRVVDRPLYDWLAREPEGAVLELPIKRFDPSPTLIHQYATLRHRHPIVNGYSGYGSALQAWLGGPVTPLNELMRMDAAVDALQSIGVRYVIVHRDDYADRDFAEETLEHLRGLGQQIDEVREFGPTAAFRLSSDRPLRDPQVSLAALPRIPTSAFKASASHGAAGLADAFDGDPDSRWITGRGQRGDEWIRIDFAEPTRVGGVRLTMTYATLGEYPRGLTIETIDEAGVAITRRSGTVLASLMKGLIEDAAYPVIEVLLPEGPPAAALMLRQTDRTGNLNWAVHELEVIAGQ
jgi:hypothetical protein